MNTVFLVQLWTKKTELTKTSELAPGILKKKNRQNLSWLLKKENAVAF
jgi:hypothetical protein